MKLMPGTPFADPQFSPTSTRTAPYFFFFQLAPPPDLAFLASLPLAAAAGLLLEFSEGVILKNESRRPWVLDPRAFLSLAKREAEQASRVNHHVYGVLRAQEPRVCLLVPNAKSKID
jgi:hypothetical protein